MLIGNLDRVESNVVKSVEGVGGGECVTGVCCKRDFLFLVTRTNTLAGSFQPVRGGSALPCYSSGRNGFINNQKTQMY